MKFLFFILGCSSLLLAFSSCSYQYYAPRDAVGLQVNEKGDFKSAATFSSLPSEEFGATDQEGFQYALQAAYSPFKHLAIAGNFSQSNSSEVSNEKRHQTNAYNIEGALGSYVFFNTRELPRKIGFLIDFYTGYGLNHAKNSYEGNDTASFSMQKFYFQTGFYILNRSPMKAKKVNFSLGFTIKAGKLFLNNGTFLIKQNYFYAPILDGNALRSIQPRDNFSFSETSVNFQVGIRPVSIFSTFVFSNSAAPEFFKYEYLNVKAGVLIDIGDLMKPKIIRQQDGKPKSKVPKRKLSPAQKKKAKYEKQKAKQKKIN